MSAMTKIVVMNSVAKDPDKVWELYTSPEHIVNWNFASDDWCCPKASNDLRVGGKMNSRMEAKDGSFGFDFEGIYEEVVPASKLTYALGDGRRVITVFERDEKGTKVTTTFDAETTHSIEMQRGGWQAILDNFKKYAEK